jgi:hypothetical protein
MATLNVSVVDQAGAPVADQLVTINTFNAHDYAQPGIEINPNPRRTGPDGLVNFYSGPPLGGAIMVQATAQNGTTDPVHFDGTTNVLVTVTLIPFTTAAAPPEPEPEPEPGPGPTPPSAGADAIDLSLAIVASGDCPPVAHLPIISAMASISLIDAGTEGQGFAMNFPGRDTWPGVIPPGWEGAINHTLWIAERIGGQWYVLPIKEGLHDYLTLGPILNPGQIPQNLTYFAQAPMYGYQPKPREQVGFFATTGDTRRMNLQPLIGAGRTNVVLVPFTAGEYTFPASGTRTVVVVASSTGQP